MNVLVVGGTGFLGGAVADAALKAGHRVAVFTRGQTVNPAVGAGIETIVGDRHSNLSALKGRSFDLVVDTCAFAPEAVASLLDALSPTIGRYALVSSASVYQDFAKPGLTEQAPTSRATPEQMELARSLPVEQRSSAGSYGPAYGPLKRECELVALERLGDRALVLRAGLLVGAGDYTDRLTYWVRRVDQGGPVPAPGDPQRLVQFIDVRDAARFVVEGAETGLGGVFNLTGRPFPVSTLLGACRHVAGSDARFVWCPDEAILAAGLEPWSEVPLWLPHADEPFRHFLEIDTENALAHGLPTRPLDETLATILAWDRRRRATPLKAGMPPEKEAALLAAVAADLAV
ncbi:NAD-dependent epimerase/dehydratase family protein [Microvirga splendida]|uniref:NAD-dependent epimerase/dehydratase family protein n=1 Tax=Microvirga splendida TaxID=2795727 RepID=A0ABS0Y512_9HYPH|nr:NAD-dependent epimerase/dehydratase family protein [Microvirga splendida]MBJ6127367.1 NAD-dependent epimerase/dehydratase family protein [Microvirga splendida]